MNPVRQKISSSSDFVKPVISETGFLKSLHFSCTEVQSSMDPDQPDSLVLEYTQLMMGFLLFQPEPTDLVMIGLGGGSLAKFCHRYLPQTHVTVVEINPHVIALRDEFLVPPDSSRFEVVEEDGAQFVRRPPKNFDVLMVDGFEVGGVPQQLCSQHFYDGCYAALHPEGVFVANFHALHPHFEIYVDRIRSTFMDRGSVVVTYGRESANAVVFASKGHVRSPLLMRRSRPPEMEDSVWHQLRPAFEGLIRQARETT